MLVALLRDARTSLCFANVSAMDNPEQVYRQMIMSRLEKLRLADKIQKYQMYRTYADVYYKNNIYRVEFNTDIKEKLVEYESEE